MKPAEENFKNSIVNELDQINFNGHFVLPAKLYLFEEVSSTMDAANKKIELAELSAVDYEFKLSDQANFDSVKIFLSRSQTKGRGRKQRPWNSVKDAGIYATYSFVPKAQKNLAGFSLVMGLAVAKTLEHFSIPLCLKWPNDVLSLGNNPYKKLSGLLTEVKSFGSNVEELVLGVGLNVFKQEFPEDLPGISMQDFYKGELNYFKVFSLLTLNILEVANSFFTNGFAEFIDQYNVLSGIKGKLIRFKDGEKLQDATVKGINDDAGLRVLLLNSSTETVIYDPEIEIIWSL